MFFPLRFWVSVSNNFSPNKVAKSIIDCHTRENSNLLHDNMELLQLRLNEIIGSKSYLLVLDDVWTVDPIKWEELGNMLRSVVLEAHSRDLAYLNEQDSWTIFRRRAFSNGAEECEEFVTNNKNKVFNPK
jgi:NB-ARC domain